MTTRDESVTAERSKIFSLTDAQLPIWLDHAFYPRTPIYNTGQTLTLQISLELDRFVEALNLVVAENDALRLRFVQADNEVAQEVVDDVPVDLQYKDLSGDKDPESAAKAWIEAIFWKPIGTEDFPLFGFAVAKLARDRFIWLQKYHHLIIDAAGRQLVCARTAAIYDSLTATGPPCEFNLKSFAKFIDSQTHCRDSESWAVDEAYWRARFGNVACPLVHSDPHLSEKSRSGRPVRLACNLSIQSSDALRSFARQQSSTVFKVFLALAWCCFRHIYGSADVIFGVPLASRRSDAARGTIGLFAKIMPFRVQLDEATTLAAALSAINRAFSEDLEHQRFPNHRINRLIRSKGHDVSNVYDVILNYQRIDYGFSFGGAPVTCSNIAVGFSVPWEITTFEHGPDAPLEIAIDYDPGRIESEEALRFFQCFQELLQRAPQCAEIALGRLPVVSAQQRATLLRRGRGERVAVLKSATLAALFADQVRRSPDATALICGHQRLTYAQLDAQAAQLARRLISLGVGPDTLVGICLRRTTLLIVAILAIHKAGGAYVPLDPGYPRERLAFMIEDANVKLILTQKEQIRLVDTRNAHLISLDELSSLSAGKASRGDPESRVNADNLAYVLYTSGSTGKPKGVAVTHGSAVNLVLASRIRIGEKDVAGILFSTSVNFDISVYEIFLPLACGGAIILADNLFALAIAPAKDEVRLINTVPSLMSAFLTESGLPDGIRVINLIGEALPRTLADRLLAERSDLRLFNLYGPTETTVYSTASLVDAKNRRSPPIGVPIWNTEAYVLDEFLELLPDGAVGELWIGGAGVAKGYLNRPELTDQRFVLSPFGEGRIYKTGDLVRWLPNGELEFCGRADQQVKINGVRIELGEVEQRLQVHPAVSEAVVTAVEDERGRKSLVAHVVSKRAGGRPSDTVIRKHLAKFLPSHSMPASVVWLNELPLTSNGKIDRNALAVPKVLTSGTPNKADERPLDEIETSVRNIWRKHFREQNIGVNQNYFELGGDSLDAFC